jgi:hypothetical protein
MPEMIKGGNLIWSFQPYNDHEPLDWASGEDWGELEYDPKFKFLREITIQWQWIKRAKGFNGAKFWLNNKKVKGIGSSDNQPSWQQC